MSENILSGKTLLVVDDEVDLRDIVASELEYMGAKVFQAENVANAQLILAENKIDLILSDIRMPGGTGIDLLDNVRSKNSETPPVILITGFADITVEDAFDKGAEALVNKPFKLDELIKMVIRYTLPLEDRFKEEVSTGKSVSSSDATNMKLGRGGMRLEVSTLGKRFDVGELVNFDLDFENTHLHGSGILRWFKASEQTAHKAVLGLEFMNLDGPSLSFLQQKTHNQPVIPYIPSAH